jgi:hypothetical protein
MRQARDLAWMQVEVNNALAGSRPGRHRVQPDMRVRQDLGPGAGSDLAGDKGVQQGRAVDALEDEICAAGFVHSRNGVTVPGHRPHDGRFERGVSARSVSAEHPLAFKGEHVRVAAARDQLHAGQLATVVIGGPP